MSNSQRITEPAPAPPVILVVEDDPDFRLQLAEALRREGFAVRTAASAEEAIVVSGQVQHSGPIAARVTVNKPVDWEALLDAIHFHCPIIGRGDDGPVDR